MDIGLIEAGLRVNQSFELDSSACRVQRENLKHEVVECDISQKLALDEQDCDWMVFTYPCTKYSTIGDIHGVRTGDELFLHSLRHMAIKKPEGYVVENVPGMRAFPVVMEAMTRLPDCAGSSPRRPPWQACAPRSMRLASRLLGRPQNRPHNDQAKAPSPCCR
ncbi:MAG TPA: DNA cytosine methyltransferase [Gemmatimonadetes bacterium]|nr:DNA cytosine methyltransferase [Gemmatimonadota bacterium]